MPDLSLNSVVPQVCSSSQQHFSGARWGHLAVRNDLSVHRQYFGHFILWWIWEEHFNAVPLHNLHQPVCFFSLEDATE